jgi:hypothetical protein
MGNAYSTHADGFTVGSLKEIQLILRRSKLRTAYNERCAQASKTFASSGLAGDASTSCKGQSSSVWQGEHVHFEVR